MSLNHLYEPYPEPEAMPTCPVCGEETETLYDNYDGQIIGCDNCIATIDAWDWQQDQADYEMGRLDAQEYLKDLQRKEMAQ